MTKLTLSMDPAVVLRAKEYAGARGTSVSRLVETMLELLSTHAREDTAATPVLRRLRGSLKRGSVADYRKHLERKYK